MTADGDRATRVPDRPDSDAETLARLNLVTAHDLVRRGEATAAVGCLRQGLAALLTAATVRLESAEGLDRPPDASLTRALLQAGLSMLLGGRDVRARAGDRRTAVMGAVTALLPQTLPPRLADWVGERLDETLLTLGERRVLLDRIGSTDAPAPPSPAPPMPPADPKSRRVQLRLAWLVRLLAPTRRIASPPDTTSADPWCDAACWLLQPAADGPGAGSLAARLQGWYERLDRGRGELDALSSVVGSELLLAGLLLGLPLARIRRFLDCWSEPTDQLAAGCDELLAALEARLDGDHARPVASTAFCRLLLPLFMPDRRVPWDDPPRQLPELEEPLGSAVGAPLQALSIALQTGLHRPSGSARCSEQIAPLARFETTLTQLAATLDTGVAAGPGNVLVRLRRCLDDAAGSGRHGGEWIVRTWCALLAGQLDFPELEQAWRGPLHALARQWHGESGPSRTAGTGAAVQIDRTRSGLPRDNGTESRLLRQDFELVLESTRLCCSELDRDRLTAQCLRLWRSAGDAGRVVLVTMADDGPRIDGCASADGAVEVGLDQPLPTDRHRLVPCILVRAALRSRRTITVNDPDEDPVFGADPYFAARRPRRVLAMPVLGRSRMMGLAYLEHTGQDTGFGPRQIRLLNMLTQQFAGAIENAWLQSRLRHVEQQFNRFRERSADGLLVLDAEHRIVDANRRAAELLDRADPLSLRSEAPRFPEDVLRPEDLERLRTHQPPAGVDAPFDFTLGSPARPRHLRAEPLARQNGRRTLLLVDRSERRLRREAEAARARAESASAAKTDFLTRMSHEIRTPLNAIVGFSQLLLDAQHLPAQEEPLRTLGNASRLLQQLVNEVLDFAKIEAGRLELQPRSFQPRALLEDLRAQFAPQTAQAGLDFIVTDEFDASIGAQAVIGDPLRLTQVLVNLIANAVKFTERGAIAVDASAQPEGDGWRLRFQVADTGPGMEPALLDGLFVPWTQLSGPDAGLPHGSGLGLSIARELVELMGGSIRGTSRPGEGTVFGFDVRVEAAPTADAAGSRAGTHPAPSAHGTGTASLRRGRSAPGRFHGRQLLIAEDNTINQRLIMEWLRPTGALCTLADSGARAVELVESRRYDLYLLDIHMPDHSGYEICRRIRARAPDAPVFATTADALASSQQQAFGAGFDEYVVKPIDYRALLELMERYLAPLPPAERDAAPSAEPPAAGPAATGAASVASLQLPGLDLGQALRAHNDDHALLARLAGRFCELYGDANAQLQQHLAAGDLHAAARLAHNLRGVAGSFGATRLRLAAGRLEDALIAALEPGSDAEHTGVVHECLPAFDQALTEAIGSTWRLHASVQ